MLELDFKCSFFMICSACDILCQLHSFLHPHSLYLFPSLHNNVASFPFLSLSKFCILFQSLLTFLAIFLLWLLCSLSFLCFCLWQFIFKQQFLNSVFLQLKVYHLQDQQKIFLPCSLAGLSQEYLSINLDNNLVLLKLVHILSIQVELPNNHIAHCCDHIKAIKWSTNNNIENKNNTITWLARKYKKMIHKHKKQLFVC